jgi:hypothetical protein
MSELRQPVRVEARSTAEVENPRWLSVQHVAVDPVDVLIDDGEAPAGGVVILREVFLEHASAERRVVPGDLLALSPRFRMRLPANDIK